MSSNITALQSQWYELAGAVGKLSPRVNPLDTSDDQNAVRMKMGKLRAKQRRIQDQIATVLDGELCEQEAMLQKEFIDALSALQQSSLENMDAACKDLAMINKRRLALFEEIKRCSRIAGRAKPRFPIHPGIHHPNELTDPSKIRLAILGLGQSSGKGSGQLSTWGGLRT